MKKTGILLIACQLLSIALFGQAEKKLVTELNVTIHSSFFKSSKQQLLQFIDKNATRIVTQDETQQNIYIRFYLEKDKFYQLDSMLTEFGYITEKKITTTDNYTKLEKLKIQLDYLTRKKSSYQQEIQKMDEKNDRYYDYWEEVRKIEEKIYNLTLDQQNFKGTTNYKVTISIYDETVDLTRDKISWVNMPGAAFNMLHIENPTPSISADYYYGYSLKYLFTRGKTYATLRVLKKASDEKTDSTAFNELFMFGMGMDFYTRYFGRGKNRFFNLYTGYNVGGVFATGDARKETIPYLEAYFGIELFKNKYILIDNKIGYFIPFVENRNMRGLCYNASFNFVF